MSKKLCLPPNPAPAVPAFQVPAGACDTHIHIFPPPERFPYIDTGLFVPPVATAEMYRDIQRRLGLTRAVLVHSAVYGMDLRSTVDALHYGNGRWRAIALVDPSVQEKTLEALDQAGFRGVRVNFPDRGGSVKLAHQLAAKVASFGWHVQALIGLDMLHAAEAELVALAAPLVIDHMGYTRASVALQHPGFEVLLRLLRQGKCWVKISGIDRISNRQDAYADAGELARRLMDANGERVLWGTDWPHVRRWPVPNDGDLLNLLGEWFPDPVQRHRILVDNPACLYRFGN